MFAQPHSQGYPPLALRGCPFLGPYFFFCCYPFFSCFKAPGCKVHDVPPTLIKQGSNKIFMFPIKLPSGNPQIAKLMAKQCHVFECFEKRKEEDGKKVNTLRLNELIIDL